MGEEGFCVVHVGIGVELVEVREDCVVEEGCVGVLEVRGEEFGCVDGGCGVETVDGDGWLEGGEEVLQFREVEEGGKVLEVVRYWVDYFYGDGVWCGLL